VAAELQQLLVLVLVVILEITHQLHTVVVVAVVPMAALRQIGSHLVVVVQQFVCLMQLKLQLQPVAVVVPTDNVVLVAAD
jgi:hypothetical protein